MSDRRNRLILALIGLLLGVGGGLSVCLGAGVFGTQRSNRDVFDATLIRWWNEGGWMSFATVVAIGLVGSLIGLRLLSSQLRRNDGRRRTPDATLPAPEGAHGETTLKASALSHRVESDLERIPNVDGALVGLFGAYPDIELRAVLDVGDHADLEHLPEQVEEVIDRMAVTAGARPHPVQITLRFTNADRERSLK